MFPRIYLRQEYWATLILVVDFWVVAIKDINAPRYLQTVRNVFLAQIHRCYQKESKRDLPAAFY
jgi:hypothetical protein